MSIASNCQPFLLCEESSSTPNNTKQPRMVLPKFSLCFWLLLSPLLILFMNYPVKCDSGEYFLLSLEYASVHY
ncbi:hypothetical protein ACSQ67_013913 [Phaseolus vulgaris]